MKKSFIFAMMATAGLMFNACSNSADQVSEAIEDAEVCGELAIELDPSGCGFESRTIRDVYSSEAASNVDNVKVQLYQQPAAGQSWVLASGGPSLSGTGLEGDLLTWESNISNKPNEAGGNYTDDSNKKTLKLKNLAPNTRYRVVAYAYNSGSAPTIASYDATNVQYVVTAGSPVEEIFAGSVGFETDANGKIGQVTLLLTRQVAGALAYFKNIPVEVDGTDVKYVKVYASAKGETYRVPDYDSYTNGVSQTDGECEVFSFDLSTYSDTDADGIYNIPAKTVSSDGYATVANSVLAGRFLVPFNKVGGQSTFKVALVGDSNVRLKTWTAKLDRTVLEDDAKVYNVFRNYFYSFGRKLKAGTTEGEDPTPGDDDNPIDLSVDNEVVVILNNAWQVIHQMGVEEE